MKQGGGEEVLEARGGDEWGKQQFLESSQGDLTDKTAFVQRFERSEKASHVSFRGKMNFG